MSAGVHQLIEEVKLNDHRFRMWHYKGRRWVVMIDSGNEIWELDDDRLDTTFPYLRETLDGWRKLVQVAETVYK